VPVEIIEKPGRLTADEYNVIFSHPFYTYRALQRISGLATVNNWASSHHERLSGRGYPRRLAAGDLQPGARIVAVADVFSAIMEERPYKKKIDAESALKTVRHMADTGELDGEITGLLGADLGAMEAARAAASSAAEKEYAQFRATGAAVPGNGCRPG